MTGPAVNPRRSSNAAIELSAVKQAEHGSDWIIRLFNTTDRPHSVRITLPALKTQCRQRFSPYEIKTLRVNNKGLLRFVSLIEME